MIGLRNGVMEDEWFISSDLATDPWQIWHSVMVAGVQAALIALQHTF